jgi:hypothetical protein
MPFAPGFEVAVLRGPRARQQRHAVPRGRQAHGPHVCRAYGGFTEEAVTDTLRAMPIPDGMDDSTASAFYSAFGTSYHTLVQRGRLRAGETLLVLGASGAIGLASVEIGKALGARPGPFPRAAGRDSPCRRSPCRPASRARSPGTALDTAAGDARTHPRRRSMLPGQRDHLLRPRPADMTADDDGQVREVQCGPRPRRRGGPWPDGGAQRNARSRHPGHAGADVTSDRAGIRAGAEIYVETARRMANALRRAGASGLVP